MFVTKESSYLQTNPQTTDYRLTTNLGTLIQLHNGMLSQVNHPEFSIPNVESFEIFEIQSSHKQATAIVLVINQARLKIYDLRFNLITALEIPTGGRLMRNIAIFIIYPEYSIHLDDIALIELANGVSCHATKITFPAEHNVYGLIPMTRADIKSLGNILIDFRGNHKAMVAEIEFATVGFPFVALLSCIQLEAKIYDEYPNTTGTFKLSTSSSKLFATIVTGGRIVSCSFCRFGNNLYSAILDRTGRILLVDLSNLLILLIYKGMRYSQSALYSDAEDLKLIVLKSTGVLECYSLKLKQDTKRCEFPGGSKLVVSVEHNAGTCKLSVWPAFLVITPMKEIFKVSLFESTILK